jgi:uncharacterized protein YdeI (YjbR/CyaY-like superfamily)
VVRVGEPAFFETEADFRRWLEICHQTSPELVVGFWKKGSGKPSIDWPQARDQALCFGWIDGLRKSLGDDAYSIRFTPRRKGSIWSKVNVDRFEALAGAGLMTPCGANAYSERRKVGVYAYERPSTELTDDEEQMFRANEAAWRYWQLRPPSYRKSATYWINNAKKPQTRARRLAALIEASAEQRLLPQYDWRKT